MKQNRFKLWMQAVDNELLEEAQKPYRRKYTFIYRIGAVAACLVLVITAVTLTQRKKAIRQVTFPITPAIFAALAATEQALSVWMFNFCRMSTFPARIVEARAMQELLMM